ncbi:MAG: rubredoxin-like domain-containing protein [Bacilli bacterium]|jgi:phage FluMu protein Com|nr:rubredoxin [Acholeplasmataceae bacterium]
MKLFKCSVCNLIIEGEHAPDKCPKCGMPAEKFNELTPEQAKKIYDADETNTLLATLIETADELIKVCHRGLEIKLDPGCVGVFEKAKDALWLMKQLAKAEIETHVKRDKW